jgi:hypothetical protein
MAIYKAHNLRRDRSYYNESSLSRRGILRTSTYVIDQAIVNVITAHDMVVIDRFPRGEAIIGCKLYRALPFDVENKVTANLTLLYEDPYTQEYRPFYLDIEETPQTQNTPARYILSSAATADTFIPSGIEVDLAQNNDIMNFTVYRGNNYVSMEESGKEGKYKSVYMKGKINSPLGWYVVQSLGDLWKTEDITDSKTPAYDFKFARASHKFWLAIHFEKEINDKTADICIDLRHVQMNNSNDKFGDDRVPQKMSMNT